MDPVTSVIKQKSHAKSLNRLPSEVFFIKKVIDIFWSIFWYDNERKTQNKWQNAASKFHPRLEVSELIPVRAESADSLQKNYRRGH